MSCMKTLVTIFALIVLCFTSLAMGQSDDNSFPALSENSYSYFGGGARAHAMGGANIGLANDVNGGSWNPAGIWILEEPTVSSSFKVFKSDGSFGFDRQIPITGGSFTPPSTGNSIDMNSIGHFSFVAPVRIKGHPFVFNFNYVRNNEETLEAGIQFSNALVTREEQSFLRTYNFGFSTRIYNQMSFGFLANVYDGGRVDEYIDVTYRDTIVDAANDIRLDIMEDNTVLDSVKASGFNLTLGLMYKFEKLSLGATVRTPFEMKSDRDRSNFDLTTIGGLPSIDGSDTIYVQNILTKQDIPLSLGFGVGFAPSEKLTIALDANYQKYGSVKWYYLVSTKFTAGGDRIDEYQSLDIDWNDVFGIGGGVEYMLGTGLGEIPLRAGFRYNQLPQPKTVTYDENSYYDINDMYTGEVELIYTGEDRQSETWLTFGTGIHWGQLGFDFVYRIVSGSDFKYTHNMNDKSELTGLVTPIIVETQNIESKSNEFVVSFIGRF